MIKFILFWCGGVRPTRFAIEAMRCFNAGECGSGNIHFRQRRFRMHQNSASDTTKAAGRREWVTSAKTLRLRWRAGIFIEDPGVRCRPVRDTRPTFEN